MEKVFNRKKELIIRDPLYDELSKTFHKIIDTRAILEDLEKYYATPYCTDNVRKKHELKYPEHWKFFKLDGALCLKWHVSLDFSEEIKIAPYTHDEIVWIGKPPFDEYTTHNASIHYPQLHWTPYPNPFNKEPILADINEFVTPGYKCEGNWISIIVDVSRIKKDESAKQVKKYLARLIDENICKDANKIPHDEYPECAFLYSLRREDTFQKYLWWYDIRTNEKLSFRIIAFIEKSKNPAELLEKFRCKKIKWGIPVKGEDRVEKGFKLIYEAIHRKKYKPKSTEPVEDKYKCPIHVDAECPPSCKYFKDWENRFNRLHPV